jgi:trans-aconitate 2-methyltransferase
VPGCSPAYAFGDDRVAAERLALLHGVFGPASATLVRTWGPGAVAVALDLGCGPGHTTRMLARACPGARVIGVDESASFVGDAARDVEVVRHDVTALPFPTPAPDLVYARFLLAHLAAPEACVAGWTGLLRDGGRVLLDEVESIDVRLPALASYLSTIAAVMHDEGHELFVGPALDAMAPRAGSERVFSEVVEVRPTTGEAARMFLPNLGVWRTRPAAKARADEETFDALADGLRGLADSDARGEIVWHMRQVVIERVV